MKNKKNKYTGVFISTLILIVLIITRPNIGWKAAEVTAYSLKEMLTVIPPIFLLLGLLDIWISKDTMVKYMGEGSGLKGIVLSFFIGSAAAGPLYGAFPVAAVFMKKGVSLTNVLIFIGAWSTTKIPMFLFEMASLGPVFAITRLIIDIPGIILIAYFLNGLLKHHEKKAIYEQVKSIA